MWRRCRQHRTARLIPPLGANVVPAEQVALSPVGRHSRLSVAICKGLTALRLHCGSGTALASDMRTLMQNSLFDPVTDLIHALELLQTNQPSEVDVDPHSGAASEELLQSLLTLARRYEVAIWEVLLPHLIRNAPQLAPETVAVLQDNHRAERQLLDALAPRSREPQAQHEGRRARAIASLHQLVDALRETVRLLETDVLAAFDALPDEQQLALVAVIEHELLRVDGPDREPTSSVSRAIGILETARSSLPTQLATARG